MNISLDQSCLSINKEEENVILKKVIDLLMANYLHHIIYTIIILPGVIINFYIYDFNKYKIVLQHYYLILALADFIGKSIPL